MDRGFYRLWLVLWGLVGIQLVYQERQMISHLIITSFNIINSYVDAYRILKNKTIAHWLNFGSYAIVVLICTLYFKSGVFFLLGSLFNRQLTFDIPLNLRRGKRWDYVSLDRPPKSFIDRMEIRVFGYNGRLPILIYGLLWLLFIILEWL